MDFFYGVLLVGVGVFVIATLLGTLSGISYARIAISGVLLALGFWAVLAIMIFRGPDNPDLGEAGWTIAAGILVAFYVAAWLLGAAIGRALRGRSAQSSSVAVRGRGR